MLGLLEAMLEAMLEDMLEAMLEDMLEDMLLEAGGKLFEDKSSPSTSSPDNHGPCGRVKFKKTRFLSVSWLYIS